MTTTFQQMTEEDQKIWMNLLHRTNLWALNLLSRDHFVDIDVINEKELGDEGEILFIRG